MMSFPTDLISFLAEPKEGPNKAMMSKAKAILRSASLIKTDE